MSISVFRAARSIFRPSAASAGGVCGRSHQRPNAALAAAYRRHMSKAVPTRPTFPVDTLAIARGMEARGIAADHAEAITAAITEVTNDGLESVGKSFVSQDQLQKEQHFFSMQRSSDTLEAKIDGLYWRIRDELTKQMGESNDRISKLDNVIQAMKAQVEVAKFEVIKYCIGTLISISTVGVAVLRHWV